MLSARSSVFERLELLWNVTLSVAILAFSRARTSIFCQLIPMASAIEYVLEIVIYS